MSIVTGLATQDLFNARLPTQIVFQQPVRCAANSGISLQIQPKKKTPPKRGLCRLNPDIRDLRRPGVVPLRLPIFDALPYAASIM